MDHRQGRPDRRPCRVAATMRAMIVHCTCPDADSAQRIACALVEERLAACVNQVPGVVSTYHWDGALRTEPEVLLLIKTTRERYPVLADRVLALHPYELPQIVAVDVDAGHAAYLDWVAQQTRLP